MAWAGFDNHVRAVFDQPDGDRVIAITTEIRADRCSQLRSSGVVP